MRKISLILSIILLIANIPAASASDDSSWSLSSPDGKILINISLDLGTPTYNVVEQGNEIIRQSPLGLLADDINFSANLQYVSSSTNQIYETYSVISGKYSIYTNHANELKLTFRKQDKMIDMYFRAYNDGIAFRYGLNDSALVYSEQSGFKLEPDSTVYAMEYERCYEQFYNKQTLSSLGGNYATPLLAYTKGRYVLMSEAALNQTYSGSCFTPMSDGLLKFSFEPKQNDPVWTPDNFLSPWRMAVIGDSSTIAQTQMMENLCPPSKIQDTSWIKPGVSGWTWYNGDPTDSPDVYKQYIDFVAEMGWQYILLDEGWQPKISDENGKKSYEGTFPWALEVIDYANAKNVGIIVWSTYWDLETPEKRQRLDQWAQMGIKGIKVDFFDSETQEMLSLYNDITEETARLQLLVNYHGCNKPTGERRTWPHILTSEAVYGFEHFLSGEGWGPTAEHNCTLPFTRNAIGAMDYTPGIVNYPDKNYFSAAHKAALPIIFESGIQCLSDKPDAYRNSKLYHLYQNLPASWDETKLISGTPSENVVIMRRKGEDYYVGSICNNITSANIRLDFLGDGYYNAEIYKDGASDTEIEVQNVTVTKADTLNISQLQHGGCVIKFTKHSSNGPIFDIDEHWAYESIQNLINQDLLNSYFFVDFKPDQKITRAEFVVMLLTATKIDIQNGATSFTDIYGHWAADYIKTASDNGIIQGVSKTEFMPDADITREEAVTIIGRMYDMQAQGATPFTDDSQISGYAKNYVRACTTNGVISGYEDNTFRPKNNITRAETATIIERLL